jgi:replicative DNA helicase
MNHDTQGVKPDPAETGELAPDDPHEWDPWDNVAAAADQWEKARRTPPKAKPAMRVPPHNTAAERSLLGAILLSRKAIDDTLGVVTPADFYTPANGHIYEAVIGLHGRGLPADVTTVAEALQRAGQLDAIGGPATLASLMADTPATSNAERYAQVVADHAAMRHIIRAGNDIAELGWSMPDSVAAALDSARDLINDIDDPDPTGAVTLASLMPAYRDLIDRRAEHGDIEGVRSGIHRLDDMTGGFRPGQFVCICGRTSMGKTAVAGQFILNADEAGHPTLIVSLEMGTEELQDRWLSTLSRVHTGKIRAGEMTEAEWGRVASGLTRMEGSSIHVKDEPAATIASIRSAARKVPGLALLVVDYLQLLTPTERRDNRQVEVSEMSAGLKRLARDLGVPVLALAQLNRGVETRGDKRPMLSDLRESGAIEQDADIVLGLYRDEYYHPDTTKTPGVIEVIVLKQRNGATGSVDVAYKPATGELLNMETAA